MAHALGKRVIRAAKFHRKGQDLRTAVEVDRLLRLSRRVPGRSTLIRPEIEYVDAASLVSAWNAIWVDGIYDLPADVHAPRIIDGGANIGVATLRWLQRHPDARITALEADPEVAAVFRRNTADRPNVELIEAALWSHDDTVTFVGDGSDAGRLSTVDGHDRGSPPRGVEVRAVPLAPWLGEPIDLLKLDIEGAEMAVLGAAGTDLSQVRRIFVEYHGFADAPHRLYELLGLLQTAGFRLFPLTEFASPRPFLERHVDAGMDLRVNVLGVRPELLPPTP